MKFLFLVLTMSSLLFSLEIVNFEKVVDGDTIKVSSMIGGKSYNVRLEGIDTPETYKMNKFWKDSYLVVVDSKTIYDEDSLVEIGKKSSHKLEDLIGDSKTIRLECSGKSSYERKLCVVYSNGVNLNKELVKLGYSACTNYSMCKSELTLAKDNKLGLWKTDKKFMQSFTRIHGDYK